MKPIKLIINIQVKERDFIESLLNCKHSNFVNEKEILFVLSLYAFAKLWDVNKLIYYVDLLELNIK